MTEVFQTSPPSAQQALEALGDTIKNLPEGLSDAQRIKACKRQLRQQGKQAEADALMHCELVQKVADLLNGVKWTPFSGQLGMLN